VDTWRFATWNVDWWHKKQALVPRAQFIADHNPDVVAVQEIRGWEARRLAADLGWNATLAHDVWPAATNAWMGCVVLCRPDITMVDAGVVDTLPKPQRSLWTRLCFPNGDHRGVLAHAQSSR
jgi:exonuclease III